MHCKYSQPQVHVLRSIRTNDKPNRMTDNWRQLHGRRTGPDLRFREPTASGSGTELPYIGTKTETRRHLQTRTKEHFRKQAGAVTSIRVRLSAAIDLQLAIIGIHRETMWNYHAQCILHFTCTSSQTPTKPKQPLTPLEMTCWMAIQQNCLWTSGEEVISLTEL